MRWRLSCPKHAAESVTSNTQRTFSNSRRTASCPRMSLKVEAMKRVRSSSLMSRAAALQRDMVFPEDEWRRAAAMSASASGVASMSETSFASAMGGIGSSSSPVRQKMSEAVSRSAARVWVLNSVGSVYFTKEGATPCTHSYRRRPYSLISARGCEAQRLTTCSKLLALSVMPICDSVAKETM